MPALAVFFLLLPNGRCLILKWSSSVTFIQCLMFMHVESFILLNANPPLYPNGWPFEMFLRGMELCFKGNMALMNIPFPHEITSCNNTALLPKDILLQTIHTLPQAHTHTRTHCLLHVPSHWACAHSHRCTHANPGRLFIY